uniref:Uncharacterized protein n=1 Tax=Cacopsylla melanoneura TaxID=428564 RepID=A0A8D8VFF9_9HEMI
MHSYVLCAYCSKVGLIQNIIPSLHLLKASCLYCIPTKFRISNIYSILFNLLFCQLEELVKKWSVATMNMLSNNEFSESSKKKLLKLGFLSFNKLKLSLIFSLWLFDFYF